MIEQTILLSNAWKDWLEKHKNTTGVRFGKYFVENYTKNYKPTPDIYYSTNNEAVYRELTWEICSGQLDGKLVDTGGPIG